MALLLNLNPLRIFRRDHQRRENYVLQEQIIDLQAQRDALDTRVVESAAANQELSAEKEDLTEKLDAAQQDNMGLAQLVKQLRSHHDQIKKKLSMVEGERDREAQARLEAEEANAAMQESLVEKSETVATLSTELNEEKESVAGLSAVKVELEEKIEESAKALAEYKEKHSELEGVIVDRDCVLLDERESSQRAVDEALESRNELESEKKKLEESVEGLQAELGTEKEKREEVEEERTCVTAEANELRTELTEAKKELEAWAMELEGSMGEAEMIEEEEVVKTIDDDDVVGEKAMNGVGVGVED